MFEYINIVIAFASSLLAGLIDLKTSDIPEEIPFLMSAFAIFSWSIESLIQSSIQPLMASLFVGSIFYAIGYILFYLGAWGEGDATILGSIGLLVPYLPGIKIFPVIYMFSLVFVGGIYSLVYSLFLASKTPEIWKSFVKRINNHREFVVLLPPIVMVSAGHIDPVLGFILSIISLASIIAWDFGKTVEEDVFVKEIPVTELKEGDVLADSEKIVGLTKEEVEKLKKRGGKVKIKEGVRFALTFPLALLLSLLIISS